MHYCRARLDADLEAYAFSVYVTDALKALAENTCRRVGGSTMRMRWTEMLERSRQGAPAQTAEEIAAEVMKRADLRFRRKVEDDG